MNDWDIGLSLVLFSERGLAPHGFDLWWLSSKLSSPKEKTGYAGTLPPLVGADLESSF